jgi:hypothetical protein
VFDFDGKSIASSDNYVAAISDDKEYSYFRYKGAVKITVSAVVICEQTGKILNKTLATLIPMTNFELANNINPEDLCGEDKYQPCCMVVIKK